jgi:hypothetical protein
MQGQLNTITLQLSFSAALPVGTLLTLDGLRGSTTPAGQNLAIAQGPDVAVFASIPAQSPGFVTWAPAATDPMQCCDIVFAAAQARTPGPFLRFAVRRLHPQVLTSVFSRSFI